jgi:hypothetical protein
VIGISKAYGGVLSALEIVYSLYDVIGPVPSHDEASSQVELGVESVKRKRFREVEEVTALYPDGRRVVLDRRSGIVAF